MSRRWRSKMRESQTVPVLVPLTVRGLLCFFLAITLAPTTAVTASQAPCSPPEPAPLEDPQLFRLVSLALGKHGELVSCVDLLELRGLGGSGNPGFAIQHLDGLEDAINLERLALPRNRIADLTPIASLTQLHLLDLVANSVEDIAPLQALHNLRELLLNGNSIVDVSPLAGLDLEILHLHSNRIEDVTGLSTLGSLITLTLDDNLIEDVSALSTLGSLGSLSLSGNLIVDVTPLAALTGLQSLTLLNNPLEDHEALGGLTSLETLSIGYQRYVDEERFSPVMREPPPDIGYRFVDPPRHVGLGWLANLSALEALALPSIYLGDAGDLESLTQLRIRVLSVPNTGVTAEGLELLSVLPDLRSISLDNNWLTDLTPLLMGWESLRHASANGNCLDLEDARTQSILEQVRARGISLSVQAQRPVEECLDGSP